MLISNAIFKIINHIMLSLAQEHVSGSTVRVKRKLCDGKKVTNTLFKEFMI